jgi:hypothetical protein
MVTGFLCVFGCARGFADNEYNRTVFSNSGSSRASPDAEELVRFFLHPPSNLEEIRRLHLAIK